MTPGVCASAPVATNPATAQSAQAANPRRVNMASSQFVERECSPIALPSSRRCDSSGIGCRSRRRRAAPFPLPSSRRAAIRPHRAYVDWYRRVSKEDPLIDVTFKDGARRAFEPGISGLDIAKSISPSLAKRTVAMIRDGVLSDLGDAVDSDATIEFIGREDPRALELIRHDAAHVLAEAVQSLWPGTQVTIGPVIDNGFYYDFFRETPFTPEDFPAIEKRMREIIARDRPFTKQVWSREAAKELLREEGRSVQDRADRCDPRRSALENLRAGRLARSLPRPAHDLDGQNRRRLQVDEGGGRLLARRFHEADAVAHLRDRLRQQAGTRRLSETARGGRAARPSQAGARNGPVPFPGGGARHGVLASQGLDAVPDADRLHAPAPAEGRVHRSQHAAGARPRAMGGVGPLGEFSREHVHHHDGG